MRNWLVTFLAALPLTSQEPDSSETRGWTDAHVRRLCYRLAEETLSDGGVGLSIAVGFGDRLVHAGGYGLAELEHGVPVDADTMFRIGSVTKQFTAALVMKRVEDGRVGLDDGIEKYLPDFDLQGHTVTVRQLLNHTSGIKSYTGLGPEWLQVVARELPQDELVDLFEDEPFDFEPGTDWRYNNSGYYLLGMLLERVERERPRLRDRYKTLVERELAEPLGLTRTRYDSNSEILAGRAQGYGGSFSTINDRLIGMSQPGAAGALLSTGKDLVRWQQALVSGQVVRPESFTAMTTPTVVADGTRHDYGFGLEVGEREGHPFVHHGGGIFGFNSHLAYVIDEELHVAVISNSERASSSELALRLVTELLGVPPVEEALEPDPAFASRRLGLLAAELEQDPGALAEFWREVDGATPLVEPHAEPGWVTVTYLWRDADATRVQMYGGADVGKEKHLARLAGTDLWFRSEVLSTRARFAYSLRPDPPLKPVASWEALNASFAANPPRPDPLNPRTADGRSYVELEDAPPQPWITARPEVPTGRLEERVLPSEVLAGERRFDVYTPAHYGADSEPCDLVVLFDGEVYGAHEDASVPTPTILDNLIAEGRLGPTVCVLVHSGVTRTTDLGQSEAFARFLATELVPLLRAAYGVTEDPARVVVGGSSLGGLQATLTAFRHPDVFGNVLSQSGSYWWIDDEFAAINGRLPTSSGKLIQEMLDAPPAPVRLWMEVGEYEGAGFMVGPNRHLRDVLRLKGYDVTYREFVGGHDYLHWRGSLGEGLVALLGRVRELPASELAAVTEGGPRDATLKLALDAAALDWAPVPELDGAELAAIFAEPSTALGQPYRIPLSANFGAFREEDGKEGRMQGWIGNPAWETVTPSMIQWFARLDDPALLDRYGAGKYVEGSGFFVGLLPYEAKDGTTRVVASFALAALRARR